MARVTLTVNGDEQSIDAEPDMPLLWALRDLIGLTGTKFGCGIGACGACMVLLGDNADRSCVTRVGDVGDRAITTIEGLSADGTHAVQQAWLAESVPQCGYCQAGQIMTTVGLLRANGSPSDADIDEAFADVLCRCGTYVRIRRAVHRAAAS